MATTPSHLRRSDGGVDPETYPENRAARDAWVLARRGERRAGDPRRPNGFLLETECAGAGRPVQVATVFLTGRECPWRCLMCDLWRHTLTEEVAPGLIPGQIDTALGELGMVRDQEGWAVAAGKRGAPIRVPHLKLYNSGSFFDPRAIPPGDHAAIAQRACAFERLIVECHPSLVGRRCLEFAARLRAGGAGPSHAPTQLEVAMGLETAHPGVLAKLNKGLTLDGFRRAADFLRKYGFSLRVFVLVKPPFLDEGEAESWANQSVDFAFDSGAEVVSLIPTRGGNGAMEALAAQGLFAPPALGTLEAVMSRGIAQGRGRVQADLWDLDRLAGCRSCFARRRARLQRMNLAQRVSPAVACAVCGGGR